MDWYTNCSGLPNLVGFLEFQKYTLLQTVLFLTDSVFYVLFAYFDVSMARIGGYEPCKSWNTVYITPI